MGLPPRTSGAREVANRVTRMPPRHPEGYIEGFANIYSDAAEAIWAAKEGREPEEGARSLPTVEDGARGLAFIEACVASSEAGGVWTEVERGF